LSLFEDGNDLVGDGLVDVHDVLLGREEGRRDGGPRSAAQSRAGLRRRFQVYAPWVLWTRAG
jgi:hypothetical protein